MLFKKDIQSAKEKCLRGEVLSKEEIVHLLGIPLGSDDDRLLRKTAREIAAVLSENRAYIWCAIGVDFQPCSMNCKFCSFGEKWGLINTGKTYTPSEIIEKSKVLC